MLEGTFLPGGFAPLPHVHRGQEESFYTLRGRFRFRLGADTVDAEPGTFVFVPRGILHGFTVLGDAPATLLAWHNPGISGFFAALSAYAANGKPDPAQLRELMTNYDMDVPP